ncbi:MAG: metal ABC transporter permease [Patescibacteria group bacterium]
MTNTLFPLILGSGILVATASGLVGSFLLLRKMTLLSDALSHIALPGIALGVLFHFEPLLGGVLFLFIGVFFIWAIEHKTKLAVETITGVLFVTALAAGSFLIPEENLLETFFGSVTRITVPELILQGVVALLIIAVIIRFLKPLVLSSIAPDLARAERLPASFLEFLLLTLIAFTIAIGISFVGILLMSALVIIPAASARNIARNFRQFIGWSVVFSVASLTIGLYADAIWHFGPGTATVFTGAFFFILTLFGKRDY